MIDYTKESKLNVKSAFEKLQKDLTDNKWGVLSVIDVKKILAEKIKVEFDDYIILDVCNPGLAYKGLTIKKQAGMIIHVRSWFIQIKARQGIPVQTTVALGTAGSLSGYDK